MNTTLIIATIAIYAEAFTLGWVAYVRADRRYLREALDEARADRNKAWKRTTELHEERLADIHRATDRINRMTTTLRAANNAAEINNASKEH